MPAWLDRWLRPREGWLSLALLFVMLLALSWSVQVAKWLPSADFLAAISFFGVVLGAALGLTRLSVVATLPISAVVGTGIVLWTVGGEYFTSLGQLGRLIAMRIELIDWFRIVIERGYPPQFVPYAVGMGILMWVTAFIAGYTVYRHHRVVDAILVVGATLIVNLSATGYNLIGYLILFVLAALLLWLRGSLVTREESWVRRRVTENLEVPSAIMRSGILFIAASIALAWSLTSVAHAAPLQGVWANLNGTWNDVRDQVAGWFTPLGQGNPRITGPIFGNSFTLSQTWTSSDSPVMTIQADTAQYMRTTTYDVYTGHSWDQSASSQRTVAPDEPFFADTVATPERFAAANLDAFSQIGVRVTIDGNLGNNVFAPVGTSGGFPTSARFPVVLRQLDTGPFFAGMTARRSLPEGSAYEIGAWVSEATAAQLSEAGTTYPESVQKLYLQLPGSVTQRTRDLAREVVSTAGATTPYDEVVALVQYLRSRANGFSFKNTVALPNTGVDEVHYFLFDPAAGRAGFCQWYATTLAVLARTLDIPARVAQGYAPGTRIAPSLYQVRAENAHAWAEIYFPGFGWQIFEATPNVDPVVRLPGVPSSTPSGGALPSIGGIPHGVGPIPDESASFNPVPGAVTPGGEAGGGAQGGNVLIIGFLLLLVVAIALWRLRRFRRSLRFLPPGERQWQRLAAAAGRAGIAQQPAETYYEYAGWLEEQIPARSQEIRTIAEGKVWESYSGRKMTRQVISAIEGAWKRLQMPLLTLAMRRRLKALWPRRGD